MSKTCVSSAVFLSLVLALFPATASAAPNSVICAHRATGSITIRKKCARAESRILKRAELVGPAGATGGKGDEGDPGTTGATGVKGDQGNAGANGAKGDQGDPGVDGAIRIYGDGSAGVYTAPGGSTSFSERNTQFTDITVPEGVILTVPSGTIFRCTGSMNIAGRIEVATGSDGGYLGPCDSNTWLPLIRFPVAGLSREIAQAGSITNNSIAATGGQGGDGALSEAEAARILVPRVQSGAGGAGSLGGTGGAGGGGLLIACRGPISIASTGMIIAPGEAGVAGGGGGAGGLIVLASSASIASLGYLGVYGGSGGPSTSMSGPGGGGGGGILHLMAPSISRAGIVAPSGGGGGSISGNVTQPFRSGGGAGGSFGGSGGSGGTVPSGASTQPNSSGVTGHGHYLETIADPTSLLLQ